MADQNDINETTRAQLDAISSALAELHIKYAPQKTESANQPLSDAGR